ncbi:MAG: hypothetical protein J2P21_15585 [Chloracidobacterium sp.]|nr:hypothetical protein [Chloracidobacterium sp.]
MKIKSQIDNDLDEVILRAVNACNAIDFQLAPELALMIIKCCGCAP